MTRIELSAEQQAALKETLKQVADGGQVILTAEGVELAAMIPMGDLEPQQDETARTEEPTTLADFLQGYVGVLHSSEYAPGGLACPKTAGASLPKALPPNANRKSHDVNGHWTFGSAARC